MAMAFRAFFISRRPNEEATQYSGQDATGITDQHSTEDATRKRHPQAF